MLIRRYIAGIFSVNLLGAVMVHGQDYPSKPIRIITGGATGTVGFTSRLIAQGISGPLGQQVVVDSRGSGVIIPEIVSKAPPDGYTLLVSGSALWLGPLMQTMPYDPVRDLSPISSVSRAPLLLVVTPSLPVSSVKELIALARAKPGELNYASNQLGGATHLAAELFKAMAGVNIVNILYKSDSQLLTDLFGGRVQLTFRGPALVIPQVKSGKLTALAVTSAEPSTLVPGLPTVAASGLPGYESVTIYAVFAPAKTPEAIIKRLNQEIVRFLKTTEAREQFFNSGVETIGSSPEELAATMKSEMTRAGKVIKDAGIKAE